MATVVDISKVNIADIDAAEVFAIDTNVLIWTHYSKASHPKLNKHPYQVIEYPNFIGKLIQNGNVLFTTMLNITELCSVVERNEYKIYKEINQLKAFSLKDYRKLSSERGSYKYEIDTMIMEIKSVYDNQIEVLEVDEKLIQDFRNNICSNCCDIFDYAVIEHLKRKGICNYISDDKDFASVSGIKLYTTSGTLSI